jgi:hypothetical protein
VPAGSPKHFASALQALTLGLAFALSGSQGHAQGGATTSGPFAGLSGSWSGSGTIMLANGTTERLRCQAAYMVAAGGRNLRQNLRCASDSYSFELRTSVDYQGGAISGTWAETARNIQGRISGSASGGRIEAVAQGPNFSAGLGIGTRGDRQSVNIRSQGTELSQVSIVLNRTR